MKHATAAPPRPPAWAFFLAFTLVYVAWGTTYLAIKMGVGKGAAHGLPPALFGGTRLVLAGLLLLGYLALRGERLVLPVRDLFWMAVGGGFLFVGGNWLITMAQVSIDSSLAAVLVASTPLWVALLETLWPGGDRLSLWGWLGLLVGMVGVVLLFGERLTNPAGMLLKTGMFLAIGSAFTWALGSLVLRYRQPSGSHLAGAAYQLIFGGSAVIVIGLAIGEAGTLTPEKFTPRTVYAFFHLLVFGSLVGFVAFNWLLKHTSATLAGTYAYVNPVVAILVGSLVDGEEITAWMLAGIAVILAGVAVVRTAGLRSGRGTGEKNVASGVASAPRVDGVLGALTRPRSPTAQR